MADKHSRPPADEEALAEFLKCAQEGDESMLPVLRQVLENPRNVDALGGDLAKTVQRELVHRTAGKNLVAREALLRKLELMRAELAGPDPSPLERMLADRVVLSWLALHEAESHYNRTEGLTIAQADFLRRRIDSLHRRFLSAIRTLATVRRLAVPILRVNLAGKPGRNGKARPSVPKALEERFALPPMRPRDG